MTETSRGALSGIRVLDLTRVLAGPLCTMMLGDMGADVIKVEPPGGGDDTRRWGPPFAAGESAYFLGANRNKRSMTLNMAVPAGQKVLAGLIEKSDVVIDNFKLGTLPKWGFTDAWFEAHAPRAVRCSITGYGSSGPKAALPGYDFVLQAESGLMSICGEPEGTPTKYGVAIVDVCTGMLACNAILAALNARHDTGRGQKVELSLFETSLLMLINVASNVLVAGQGGGRFGNGHPSLVPYTTYHASDAMIALAVGNEPQFAKCAAVLGHPEWADDPRFNSNRARVENRTLVDGVDRGGAGRRHRRRLDRQVQGGGRAVRPHQFGSRGARRSAYRGAPDDRDGAASRHRRIEAGGHALQVFGHSRRPCAAPRRCSASTRRKSCAKNSASMQPPSLRCAAARWCSER